MTRRPRTRGMTLMETMCAMFVLGVATTAAIQLMTTLALQRRLADRRTLAAEEAANRMEEIYAMPWPDVTAERLADLSVSESLQALGGDPAIAISVEEQSGQVLAKEIQITIDWAEPGGGRSDVVQFAAWRYRPQEVDQ